MFYSPSIIRAESISTQFDDLSLLDLLDLDIEAASKEKESIREAPAPVSVITRTMIRQSQAKTLRDVILEFVPGVYYVQGGNEYALPFRGIYSGSQDKVLILRNGIRLNSRGLNRALPDYSISLENIKQIEIIRGPGASIYGNAALTAVINIVTIDPDQLDGFEIMGGPGSYGELQLSATYGKQFNDEYGIVLWASLYQSDGEELALPESEDYSDDPVNALNPLPRTIILGRFNEPYAFDIGGHLTLGDFVFDISIRRSKMTEPFSALDSQANRPYDYHQIASIEGHKPGSILEDRLISITWNRSISPDIDISISGAVGSGSGYFPSIQEPSLAFAIMGNTTERFYNLTLNSWFRYNFLGTGRLLVGAEFDLMDADDSHVRQHLAGEWVYFGVRDQNGQLVVPTQLVPQATEETISAFVQTKHYLTDKFLINLGLRYDERFRFRSDNIREFSPRIAAVWLPSDTFSVKLSWASSFVDAPYILRFNRFFPNAQDLTPERYSALQLTPSIKLFDGKLAISNNTFLTRLSNFTVLNAAVFESAAADVIGNELEIASAFTFMTIRANTTFINIVDSDNYRVTNNEIDSIPNFVANLTLDFFPIPKLHENLWIHTAIQYIGERYTPNFSPFDNGPDPTLRQNATALVHAALGVGRFGWDRWLITLRVDNVLDTRWYQGGDVEHPYPQLGRWISARLRLKI